MAPVHKIFTAVVLTCCCVTSSMRSVKLFTEEGLTTNETLWPFDGTDLGNSDDHPGTAYAIQGAGMVRDVVITHVKNKVVEQFYAIADDTCKAIAVLTLGKELIENTGFMYTLERMPKEPLGIATITSPEKGLWQGSVEREADVDPKDLIIQEEVLANVKTLRGLADRTDIQGLPFKVSSVSSCPSGYNLVNNFFTCKQVILALGFQDCMSATFSAMSMHRYVMSPHFLMQGEDQGDDTLCSIDDVSSSCLARKTISQMNDWYPDRDAHEADCKWQCSSNENSDWCIRSVFTGDHGGSCYLYDCPEPTCARFNVPACVVRKSISQMNTWFDRDAHEGDCEFQCNSDENNDWCIRSVFTKDYGGSCYLYDCEDPHADAGVQTGYLCRESLDVRRQRAENYRQVESMTVFQKGQMYQSDFLELVPRLKSAVSTRTRGFGNHHEECMLAVDRAVAWGWEHRCEILDAVIIGVGWAADKALFAAASVASGGTFAATVGTFMATYGEATCHVSKFGAHAAIHLISKLIGKAIGFLVCHIEQHSLFRQYGFRTMIKDSLGTFDWNVCNVVSVPQAFLEAGLSLLCGKVVTAVLAIFKPIIKCALGCKEVGCHADALLEEWHAQ